MAESIIIDTDPGQDDAFAILLALASPELEVLGLTTVAGNGPLPVTSRNARQVLELAGAPHIPVRAGADRPLLRPSRFAEEVHGKTGLDGYRFPEPTAALAPGHAADWIVETVMARPTGTVTLVPIGPLTNIALALAREPALARRLRRIVLMGGGFFQGGNMSPAAEFNILVDPEAAAIVVRAGVDLTAVPIDCTYACPTPDSWIADLQRLGTPVGDAGAGMMDFFQRFGNEKYGTATRPLHDALAVGYLLWPELFSGRRCNVEIETASALTVGMTVVDWWGISGRPANCLWLTGCDRDRFYGRMLERLAGLPLP